MRMNEIVSYVMLSKSISFGVTYFQQAGLHSLLEIGERRTATKRKKFLPR